MLSFHSTPGAWQAGTLHTTHGQGQNRVHEDPKLIRSPPDQSPQASPILTPGMPANPDGTQL